MTSFRKKIKQYRRFPKIILRAIPAYDSHRLLFDKLELLLRSKAGHLVPQADFDLLLTKYLSMAVNSYEGLAFALAMQRLAAEQVGFNAMLSESVWLL